MVEAGGGDVATSQKKWIPLEGRKHSPLEPPERTQPVDTLISAP